MSARLSSAQIAALGLGNKASGDVGEQNATTVRSWITSLTGEAGKVTPGTTNYASTFATAPFAGKVPPLLTATAALQTADALRPVVGTAKRYGTQVAGLLANVTNYPVYNLIAYPNIRFGYAEPGEPFVAKRNWWAFTVKYGNSTKTVAKHYVLSLYEVPSQMPIEASTFAQIGRHLDGTAWNSSSITIDGSVYADRLAVNGAFGASRLAGRQGIEVTGTVNLDGVTVGSNFDAMGVREGLQVNQRSDVLPVALSPNSGRLAFMPIQPGTQFLTRLPTGTTPTEWQNYTAGAQKCQVTVEATAMVSLQDQTPTALRVKFKNSAGALVTVTLTRGSTWPTQLQTGGAVIPFQTELTSSNRSCLTFYPALLNAWIVSKGGVSVATNNSVFLGVDSTVNPATVRTPQIPPIAADMCVIIRKGLDLRSYTAGLSVVAPSRVYVGDDLNAMPATALPTGSGLPAGTEFFPPMSIFASQLRIGTTAANRLIEHHGQLGTLAAGGSTAWQPLDMKSGGDESVHSENISADLKPLRSPAELPPIHQMNWLVVVEEIPQD